MASWRIGVFEASYYLSRVRSSLNYLRRLMRYTFGYSGHLDIDLDNSGRQQVGIFQLLLIVLCLAWVAEQGVCLPAYADQKPQANKMAYIPGTRFYSHDFTAAEVAGLEKSGLKLATRTTDNFIKIESGNILLSPDQDIVIGTNVGDIKVSAGAVAFIMTSTGELVVYDLRQSKSGQISVLINDKDKLVMEPGYMLALMKEGAPSSKELLSGCHAINYWGALPINLSDDNLKAFAAEFSISSALANIQPLQEMIASNNKQEQMIIEKIMKGAAIMGDYPNTTARPELATKRQKLSAYKKKQLPDQQI